MKRPLFTLGWFFLAGTAAAVFLLPGGWWVALPLGAALLAGLAWFCWRRRVAAGCFIFALAVLLGWAWAPLRALPALSVAGQEVMAEGVVEEVYSTGTATVCTLWATLTNSEGSQVKARLQLYCYEPQEIRPGMRAAGPLTPQEIDPQGRELSLLRERCFLFSRMGEGFRIEGKAPGLYGMVLRYREQLLRQNAQFVPGEEGALINAILLGEKSGLSLKTRSDLNGAGLAHIAAVSGFHLSVLTGCLLAVLRLCRLPQRLSALLALPFVVFFTLLAGCTPSVLRAALMTTLLLAAQLLRREYDSLTAWGFAVIICCVLNPYSLTDIGCVLSYSSTLGILLWYPAIRQRLLQPFGRLHGLPRKLLEAVASSLSLTGAALLLSLPFMSFAFGYVSLWAGLSSLLALPLAAPLLGLSMAAGGVGLFWPAGARWLLELAEPLARDLLAIAHWVASLPMAVYPVRYPAVWGVLVVCCLLAALGLSLQARARWLLPAGAVLGVGLLLICCELLGRNTLMVTALEGQDSLIFSQGRSAVVCSAPARESEVRAVYNAVQAGGYQQVGLVIPENRAENCARAGELIRQLSPDWVIAPSNGRYAPHIAHAAGERLHPLAPMHLALGNTRLRFAWAGDHWEATALCGKTRVLKFWGSYAIIEGDTPPGDLVLAEENTLCWQGEGVSRCIGGQGKSWVVYNKGGAP